MIAIDPPLRPGAEEARKLLQHELSKPKYGDQRGLIERFIDWIGDLLSSSVEGVGGLSAAWTAVLLATIGIAIAFGLTKIRRKQGNAGGRHDLVDEVIDDSLTAKQLRAAAAQALGSGDTATAFVQYFRAMVRAGVERTIVAGRPGATAHEVTTELATAFPAYRNGLNDAASTFDQVRYGGSTPSAEQVDRMRTLDAEVAKARPYAPTAGVSP